MWLAPLLLFLIACEPVILGEEQRAQDGDSDDDVDAEGDGSAEHDAAAAPGTGSVQSAEPSPVVVVRIKPLDCGTCFELEAEGDGGLPPYIFQWDDGSRAARRSVCLADAATALTVVAVDANDARSAPQTLHLQGDVDAGCGEQPAATDAGPAPRLCLENLSFEGTPGINMGQAGGFDAPPWNACTNPLRDNTPDIGNETIAFTPGVPAPIDGLTYVALGEGEQVSQGLCAQAPSAPVSLELDLSRIDLGGGVVPETERVFLEIWGGLGVDCSQRELLWASPGLQSGWQRFCVTLQPQSYLTQLTLRANADMTLLSPAYLLVDNLKPVDACP